MKVYIMPISGGGFVAQIAMLKAINDAVSTMKPDLVLGSSGGQIAAYLAMIGDWNSNAIMRNVSLVDSALFVESWTPPFFPTWVAFLLTKSIYKSGSGIQDLFNSVYTSRSITNTEIWSGTYDSTSQKSACFCNLKSSEALIKDLDSDKYIYDSQRSVYLNGVVNDIAKVVYASASIPYVTPGVMIAEGRPEGRPEVMHLHKDGGSSYGSPLVPMKSKVVEAIRNNPSGPIQIFHFSSYDMNEVFKDNMFSNSIGLLIHSMLLQDRSSTLDLLREFGKVVDIPDIYLNIDAKGLRSVLEKYKDKSYVMMLAPMKAVSVNVTMFTQKELINAIREVEKDFQIMVWSLVRLC
jgi:predicted acylesterase/phospholipase RssA